MKSAHVLLFGPPGVGKGAQASIIQQAFDVEALSTGEVLRDEIRRGTALGRRVEAAVNRGHFADDETVLQIVLARIDQAGLTQGFVMDGFPRTVTQAQRLDSLLEDRGRHVDAAFFLQAPERTIVARLRGRCVCRGCGMTYHDVFRPPHESGECDGCGGLVARRADDNPETHRERLRVYREKTAPLEDYYRSKNLVVEINADQSIEAVAAEIQAALSAAKAARTKPQAPVRRA